MSKIAIIGSRTFNDYKYLEEILSKFKNITHIFSGGQRSYYTEKGIIKHYGADWFAECYARNNQIPITIFHAEWNKFGKIAGLKRNKQIVDSCDELVAFWDKKSKGTNYSIQLAKKLNKKVHIFSNGNFKTEKKDSSDKILKTTGDFIL